MSQKGAGKRGVRNGARAEQILKKELRNDQEFWRKYGCVFTFNPCPLPSAELKAPNDFPDMPHSARPDVVVRSRRDGKLLAVIEIKSISSRGTAIVGGVSRSALMAPYNPKIPFIFFGYIFHSAQQGWLGFDRVLQDLWPNITFISCCDTLGSDRNSVLFQEAVERLKNSIREIITRDEAVR